MILFPRGPIETRNVEEALLDLRRQARFYRASSFPKPWGALIGALRTAKDMGATCEECQIIFKHAHEDEDDRSAVC